MTKEEALDLALEALELSSVTVDSFGVQRKTQEAITAIKQARSAPVQEPVAVYGYCPVCGAEGVMRERRPNGYDKCAKGHTYPSSKATPPAAQRQWVGLTDDERVDLWKATETDSRMVLIDAIEAKLKEKNT